ncbi:hypothetical protein QBC36DRAFT_24441 [Triangularia setosa]|uniref:Uncharacterized protein n=1 Tax=Triangularia setosa TaxID=2587417 RepID=A0AAN6W764_9PEZI|nr:hypothetical protein QBC36DRAFT_24441 [Podospora setosa]
MVLRNRKNQLGRNGKYTFLPFFIVELAQAFLLTSAVVLLVTYLYFIVTPQPMSSSLAVVSYVLIIWYSHFFTC